MNSPLVRIVTTVAVSCVHVAASAYELGTHARLTYKAYEQSVLSKDNQLLEDLGIDLSNPNNPFGTQYYDASGSEVRVRVVSSFEAQHMDDSQNAHPVIPLGTDARSIPGWLLRGAIREDDYLNRSFPCRIEAPNPQDDAYPDPPDRPLSHFYDPVFDRQLTLSPAVNPFLGHRQKAPDWATGAIDAFDRPNEPNASRRNHFTIFDAREALYRALTGKNKENKDVAKTKEERDRYWATSVRALGDVVHLIQDMAVPHHTRNDAHSGACFPSISGHASVFEHYVEARATQSQDAKESTQGLEPTIVTFPNVNYGNYPTARFTKYADFFSTARRDGVEGGFGLADYSNRGFFSTGTNLGDNAYPLPSNNRNHYAEQVISIDPRTGSKTAYLLDAVFDTLNAALRQLDVPKTKESLWYDAVAVAAGAEVAERLGYTLDQRIYDFQADLLIPRAVAYSAGLIDYFFRGRLEAVDPEFSETGVRLKVRNAIDTNKFPEWTGEYLYREDSQGRASQFVLTVKYREGEEERLLASEPVGFKAQQLVSPGATAFETLSFDLPWPPEGATNIEYRLVFRGRLGAEDDAVAVGIVEPVSGFVVRPNYVGQNRLIVNTRGQWRVQPSVNTNADHIDWKGWYFNGKPTKVLSWLGPVARYFPNEGFGPEPFGSNIYQNGEVFARAPCRVLGATITKDGGGREWLIAICKDAAADVLYRRPNTKNGSPALFDPVFAPEGWEEVGRIPAQSGALEADVPWFFSGDGTEAQTMRLSPKTIDGISLPLWRDRYKIVLTDAESIAFENIGNDVGKITETRERVCEPFGGVRKESLTQRLGADTVVAVDYVNKNELLARLVHNGVADSMAETLSSGNSTFESVKINSSTEQTLKWSGRELNVLRSRLLWDKQVIRPGSIPDNKAAISEESRTERKLVIYFDMRNDFLVYFEDVDGYSIDSDGVQDCNRTVTNCAPVPVVVATLSTLESQTYQFISKTGTQAIYQNSKGDNKQINTPVDAGACSLSTTPENRTETKPFGGLAVEVHSGYHPGVSGRLRFSGAADSGGNLGLSMQYRDVASLTYWFNFLTDGDLRTLIPNAPQNPTYFPVYVVK